jgi:hypothetical protein
LQTPGAENAPRERDWLFEIVRGKLPKTKNQPAAAANAYGLRSIVSGLLFTMNRATCARTGTAADFGETNAMRILAKRSQRDFRESNFVVAERKS